MAILPEERMQYFDVEAKTWKTLPVASSQIGATRCYCAVSVGDKLIVAAEDSLGNCIYHYDIEANVWERHPHSGLNISKLCVTEQYLYAFYAGCNEAPQRYNFAKRQWQKIAKVSNTNNDRSRFFFIDVAVLNSKVYALYNEKNRQSDSYHWRTKSTALHCFYPQANRWEVKATTSLNHVHSSLTEVNSKLFVAWGKTVEMYSEETNRWSTVPQKHIPGNNLNAVVMGGRVYFIVKNFPVDSGIRIAHGNLNSADLNEWENLGKIDENAALCFMTIKRESGQ